MNIEHSVIQYVRNKKGIPLGIIVAVKTDEGFSVGYSLCSRKDRFKKETGLKIAFGRAESWTFMPDETPKDILKAMPSFIERCKKYYRTGFEPRKRTYTPF